MPVNSINQRERLRDQLAIQTAAFEAMGGAVQPVGFKMRDLGLPKGQYGRTHYPAPAVGQPEALADTHLVEKLRAHAALGDSVVTTAGLLHVSPAHCRKLASAHHIAFRR